MYVAEQNMVGAAVGLNLRGQRPFVSSFAAFLTRAFDQIRMSRYSDAKITFAGSHAGVSIGKDGPSQMGLEDIAMFRTILGSAVLYPSDAVATEKLVETAAGYEGIAYLRLTRSKTPVLYEQTEEFPIGGSKTVRESDNDAVTIITAGYTLHEAISACDTLAEKGVYVRVIDLYSIKPIDKQTLEKALSDTGNIMIVEDHYVEGGIGDAVFAALQGRPAHFHHLAVRERPGSGPPQEILNHHGLTADVIAEHVRIMLKKQE
jgi:transketolase